MTVQNYKILEYFKGSDQFYLADPNKVTIKKNGGKRWGVLKEFNLDLEPCLTGHLDGSLNKGVVLPPIRKSDNKCRWGAIDVDGEVYNNEEIKIKLLQKVEELKLPLIPCYSKSKGLHLYIFFMEWTAAKTVRDILQTFLHKLDLPPETECFPKQVELSEKETGNGIMLPHMKGVGNDFIKSFNEKKIFTGTLEEFEKEVVNGSTFAEDIKIELPKKISEPAKLKRNGDANFYKELADGPTKLQILKNIKDGTIKDHKNGGKYHNWIQLVIAKAVYQGYGDNEILKMIKEVHQDNRGIGYVWPESYQKQINYTRKDTRFNTPNPGDTKFLKKHTFDSAVKLEEITKRYCYVMANDMYNKLGTGDFFQGMQINNFHAHEVFFEKGSLTQNLLGNKKFKKAETFITSAKYKPGIIQVDRPGIVPLINKGLVLNIYIPNYIIPKKGDVNFIIDFFVWLIGEKKWRIIEQWIAYMLQYPGEKMKWAVVLVSVIEGVGKGLLARICSRVLGEENVNENANYKHLTNTHNTLLVGTQLLVLNEVSLGDFKSKQEGTNTLKNFVADDIYSCNFKNKPMVKLPNLTNFMLFSNDERVLGAPQGGRRYYFNNIQKTEDDIIQKTDEGFFDQAWKFVDSDEGAAALLYYFKNEVKIEDPSIFKKRAPQTDDLVELIEQSKHPLQKKLEFDLTRLDNHNSRIFTLNNWCGLATFDWLNNELHTRDKDETKQFDWGSFGDDAIYKFLSANADPWNNGENTRQISINGVKHRFYILDDSCCPIPDKSYKDLTPKQIETIYKNYSTLKKEIREEEPNYKEAKIKIPEMTQSIMEEIRNGHSYKKLYKNQDPNYVFKKLMNGELKLHHNDQFQVESLIKMKERLARGIRTPEAILDTYMDKQTENTPKPRFSL